MSRGFFVWTFALMFLLLAEAHARPEPAKGKDTPGSTETVIRLAVQPAPAAKPALRYQLLPDLREMNPGNPIQGYLLCFMEQNPFFFSKQAGENRDKWSSMPLADLPRAEMDKVGFGKDGTALKRADYAARLETVDWQTLLKLKKEGASLAIPEVQALRTLAVCLKIRFRLEVAERRFDDALITAKTMFAMTQHLGEHPTLIGNLVGMATANLAIGPLEEMLQQPGCPNLFWALANLPRPVVSLRTGMRGERIFLDNLFNLVDETTPLSDAQLKSTVDRVLEVLQILTEARQNNRAYLAALSGDETAVAAARKRLIAVGIPEERVKKFLPMQVILLDHKLSYEILRDEGAKAMTLPYWQAEPLLINPPKADADKEKLFTGLVASYFKVRMAQVRVDQRVALLTCVEALRVYAAEHDGQLPDRLDDIHLPIPADPVTGKAFSYKRDGEIGHLHGTAPKGMEKNPGYNVRYEVTIKKAK